MRMLENFTVALLAGSITIPLAATALLAFMVATFAAFLLPSGNVGAQTQKTMGATSNNTLWRVPKLLFLAFIVSAGVGVFEVGLALRGKQESGLTPTHVAFMFTERSPSTFCIARHFVTSRFTPPEVFRSRFPINFL